MPDGGVEGGSDALGWTSFLMHVLSSSSALIPCWFFMLRLLNKVLPPLSALADEKIRGRDRKSQTLPDIPDIPVAVN